MSISNCKNAAFEYLALGWAPVAVCPPDHIGESQKHIDECKSIGKCPRVPWKPIVKGALPTKDEIDRWWSHGYATRNVGVILGGVSRLIGIDVDGERGAKALGEACAGELLVTCEFTTPSGGRRLLYLIPDGVKLRTTHLPERDANHEGVSYLAEGGHTVMPPSRHRNGGTYAWVPGKSPWEIKPALAPDWLVERLRKVESRRPTPKPSRNEQQRRTSPVIERARAYVAKMPPGISGQGGHSQTFAVACALVVGFGLTPIEAWPIMLEYNARCEPPWSEAELQHKLDDADAQSGERGYLRDAEPKGATRKRSVDATDNANPDTEGQPDSDDPGWDAEADEFGLTYDPEPEPSDDEIRQALGAPAEPWTNGHPDPSEAPKPKNKRKVKAAPQKKRKRVGIVKALADKITASNSFAQDVGGAIYVFRRGAYGARGEQQIKRAVKWLCNQWDLSEKWSPRLADNVVEYIRVDAPMLWEKPPLDLLNVQNGLLRIADLKLLPHSPAYLSPVQLPVTFDPLATCPRTDWFYGDVLPADTVELAFEVLAWLMLPNTSIQKAILFLGEGANGKSTMLRQWVSFLGKSNVASLSLHRLEQDKFSVARLVGKLANICPDLPSAHLESTAIFKAITGGDPVTGERKFHDSFDFVPYSRLVFSANHPPCSKDASSAFFRRWTVVPFRRTYGPGIAIPKEQLDAELSTPGELSGLLNKALEALPRLENGEFTESESTRIAAEEFHATTDPLAIWLEHNTVDDPSSSVEKNALICAYNQAASGAGRPTLSNTAFGLALKRLRPMVEDKQRTLIHGVKWCYVGIGLSADQHDEAFE